MKMNIKTRAALLSLLFSGLAVLDQAYAHGALSMDEDACKLAIGPYFMHFTGYQPRQSGNEEFCEDIPETGQTIIVLDSIDEVLKDMEIAIRISAATADGAEAAERVLYEQPFRGNSRGSITVMQDFGAEDSFVGIVTARSADAEYVASFPFSVGLPAATAEPTSAALNWAWAGLAALLVVIAALFIWRRRRQTSTVEATGG